MKKFWLIIFSVAILGLGANRAFTNPDPPSRPERKAMRDAFAYAFAGNHYRLGVVLSEVSPHMRGDSGVKVERVLRDSPAEKAGLKDGDIIVSIDGKKVESEEDIRKPLRDLENPREIALGILRDGKSLNISVMPEKREMTLFSHFGGNYIGVDLQELDADLAKYFQTQPGAGVLVARVEPNSPAEKGGMKSGDVITELNGEKVATDEDVRDALKEVKEGDTASLTILRHGKVQNITVKPEKRSFDFPQLQELGELRDLPKLQEFRELRDLHNNPEFRESMQELRREMEKLKEEMRELKKELRESD
ncbi:PDZ domain-containing protein [bacterium]|nr:PDZ domain-containing protein [bacterium]